LSDSNPLLAGQLIQADQAARADFVSAHADFCIHVEFAAVGEPRARIPLNRRRIHPGEKLLIILRIF